MGGFFGVASYDDCVADLVEAIGLPKGKICTYCWDGRELK